MNKCDAAAGSTQLDLKMTPCRRLQVQQTSGIFTQRLEHSTHGPASRCKGVATDSSSMIAGNPTARGYTWGHSRQHAQHRGVPSLWCLPQKREFQKGLCMKGILPSACRTGPRINTGAQCMIASPSAMPCNMKKPQTLRLCRSQAAAGHMISVQQCTLQPSLTYNCCRRCGQAPAFCQVHAAACL